MGLLIKLLYPLWWLLGKRRVKFMPGDSMDNLPEPKKAEATLMLAWSVPYLLAWVRETA